MNIDTETPAELEYDDGCLTISWTSPDHSERFSIRVADGSVIGVHCTSPPARAKSWKMELPPGFVKVDETVIETLVRGGQ